AYVGDAPPHILKPFFIGLIVGNVIDSDTSLGDGNNFASKLRDGDFLRIAEVKNLPDGLVVCRKQKKPLDGVGHKGETAGLLSAAINCQVFSSQRLIDEARDHHAVPSHLPGTDGIEEAGDHGRKSELAAVSNREKLIDDLARCIAPTRFASRTEDQV